MTNLRDRFFGFPWVPSFVVSFLASLFFFAIDNLEHIPQSVQALFQSFIQFSTILIAIGGFIGGCLSLYYNRRQKKRWKHFERELQKKANNVNSCSKDVTKSPTDLLIEWIDRVDDLLWISEDGQVTITEKNLKDAQKIVLYLIGVRYAFELDLVDSPEVNSAELAKKTNVPQMAVHGWYLPLNNVIKKRHLEIWERFEGDPYDTYRLDIENVDKAFHYVTGEEQLPEPLYY